MGPVKQNLVRTEKSFLNFNSAVKVPLCLWTNFFQTLCMIKNEYIEWFQSNGDLGGMVGINYFFNMSVMSLYNSWSFLIESITTSKLLSGNMTIIIQWLLA